MLPRLLCEELCSLNPNEVCSLRPSFTHTIDIKHVLCIISMHTCPYFHTCTHSYTCTVHDTYTCTSQDRLAFSVVWKMTIHGEVCSTWSYTTRNNDCLSSSYTFSFKMSGWGDPLSDLVQSSATPMLRCCVNLSSPTTVCTPATVPPLALQAMIEDPGREWAPDEHPAISSKPIH